MTPRDLNAGGSSNILDHPLFGPSCFLNLPLFCRGVGGLWDSLVTSLTDSNLEGFGLGGLVHRVAWPGLSLPVCTGGQGEIISAGVYGRSQND